MCSFRSSQTRFEFLSQFRKVRNAFECFVTQVQTRLPKTKCVWPMKINVICTVLRGHREVACSDGHGNRVLYNWRERRTRPLEHASVKRAIVTVFLMRSDV